MASTISAGTTTTTALVYSADTSGVLQLQTNGGTTAVTIDIAQNFGLGVTPSAWGGVIAFQNKSASVAVTSNGNNMDLATNRYYNGTSDLFYQTGNYALMYEQASGSGVHRWFTSTATGTAGNAITFTQAMSLDASGNLLVGTTAITTGATEIMALKRGGVQWSVGPNSTNGSFDVFNSTATGVYLSNGSTSWSSLSDETMKDIIEPIENAVTKVSTLRAVIGKYKTDEDGTRRSFLIAQDVQAVLPEAVDATNPNKLGVSYTDVIPLLVAAIKEQQAMITTLQTQVTALKG